ncbi:major capsid protein [Tortoise microvirus 30]|nr:major capsid protein [Tortoise microvirus 30]
MTHLKNIGKVRIKRSAMNLNYRKIFNTDMGVLYPIQADVVLPSDIWKMTHDIVIRLQPLIAPILHEINVFTHTFFIPLRLIDENFENALTGGVLGDQDAVFEKWDLTNNEGDAEAKHTLWDALAFPIVNNIKGPWPVAWPRNAYNLIYNEFYRDQNLQAEIPKTSNQLLKRAWNKDYFTSALPTPQRGPSLALPISGQTFANYQNMTALYFMATQPPAGNSSIIMTPSPNTIIPAYSQSLTGSTDTQKLKDALSQNIVDLSVASTFDVNDLRAVVQLQKWKERNMRAGVRLNEFLMARWSCAPRDDRLQRPEYIGGTKSPVIISEVLQTSESQSTPQGTMAGHGLSANISGIKKYRVQEPGIIMTLMSIMPKSTYQQGIDRQWLMETRYDFPFPEFTHLGEREILRTELMTTDNEYTNKQIWGFRGIFDEHRSKLDRVCGDMRDTYKYWHLGRIFNTQPNLNSSFIQMNGADPTYRRIFAVQNEPGFICHIANRITALRPLPIIAEPGLMDHF